MPRLKKQKLRNLLNLGNFSKKKKQQTTPEPEIDDAMKENVSKHLFANTQQSAYNGQPHYFYDTPSTTVLGTFKGMTKLLQERGLTEEAKLNGSCKNFKCATDATRCCQKRVLYNQPDFTDQLSAIEIACKARGFEATFLPKFHCELNFIEQCWGHAKRVYRQYPPSSKEEDLERNVLSALESVPVEIMRKYARRSRRFIDAYYRGLDGKQAAWASRKYRGHRMMPETVMDDLMKAGL